MAVWLVLLSLAAGCQVWTCEDSQDPEVCLTWSADRIVVNSQGCPSFNQQCSYSLALQAIEKDLNGSYTCEVVNSQSASQIHPFASCGKREPEQRRLKAGTFPQECKTEGLNDPTCELNDGSFIPCTCGLNGRLYCQPNPSDMPFNDFWTACEAEEGVVTEDFFKYYELMSRLYAESTELPECIGNKMFEFKKLGSPAPDASWGIALGLSSLLLW